MFNYFWNITVWAYNELIPDLRDAGGFNLNWLLVLLSPIQYLYNAFITYNTAIMQKINCNGQTIILENTLNDLYDPAHRRIKINTSRDILPINYLYLTSENNPLYIYTQAEYVANPSLPRVYLFNEVEYGNVYDFVVSTHSASLTAAQIVQLKASVNYYRYAGKKPTYIYYDTLQSF